MAKNSLIYDPILGELRGSGIDPGGAREATLQEVKALVDDLHDGLLSGCDIEQNNDGENTYTLIIDDTVSVEGGTLTA